MTKSSAEAPRPQRALKSRSIVVKPGRLPLTEATYDKAGAASPFGDDIEFPFPPDRLTYEHPPAH